MTKTDTYSCDCDVIHEEVVSRVRAIMPDNKYFCESATIYKILGDSTRIKILWALSIERMCVCDLAVLIGMTKSAVSHQLKSLRLAKLVEFKKQGREVYYSLSDTNVKSLLEDSFAGIKSLMR